MNKDTKPDDGEKNRAGENSQRPFAVTNTKRIRNRLPAHHRPSRAIHYIDRESCGRGTRRIARSSGDDAIARDRHRLPGRLRGSRQRPALLSPTGEERRRRGCAISSPAPFRDALRTMSQMLHPRRDHVDGMSAIAPIATESLQYGNGRRGHEQTS
jgi:hypothetical protein